MKRVFQNSSQTIHVWAQQLQSEGRSSNMFFNGNVIYSYGYHYPLGAFVTNKKNEQAVLINDSGYSVTTAKHIRECYSAVRHHNRIYIDDTELMKALIRATNIETIGEELSAHILRIIKRYNDKLAHDDKKRQKKTLEQWKDSALADCAKYMDVASWYGAKISKDAKTAIKKLSGLDAIAAKDKAFKALNARLEKEAKERAEAQARLELEAKESIPLWLAGDDTYKVQSLMRVFRNSWLRVKGDIIETSHGAQFPVDHAKRAFTAIRHIKENNGYFDTGAGNHPIRLGHFQIDKIESTGRVIAGCHIVEWDAIEHAARVLKIFP